MFEASIARQLATRVSGHRHQVVLRTFGLPESEVNDLLGGVEAAHQVIIGYAPACRRSKSRLASADNEAEARARGPKQRRRTFVPGWVVTFSPRASAACRTAGRAAPSTRLSSRWRSLHGGLAGELLTSRAGSSRYFLGAAVVYSIAENHALAFCPSSLNGTARVSAEVARAMARQPVCGLGQTGPCLYGIAGRTAEPGQAVGLVHIALHRRVRRQSSDVSSWGSRNDVRRRCRLRGLRLFVVA
jgi:nicotinamide mononucleotide (NMN) deamidase PncC